MTLVAGMFLILCVAASLKGMIALRYEDEGGGGTWLLYPLGALGALLSGAALVWRLFF
jgi:hypothetical protein